MSILELGCGAPCGWLSTLALSQHYFVLTRLVNTRHVVRALDLTGRAYHADGQTLGIDTIHISYLYNIYIVSILTDCPSETSSPEPKETPRQEWATCQDHIVLTKPEAWAWESNLIQWLRH